VIEIHDIRGVATTTVCTGNILGLLKRTPVALHPLVLKLKVVGLVLLVILALVVAVTNPAPMLRLAIGPNSKITFR
jgi:hypothetical protein